LPVYLSSGEPVVIAARSTVYPFPMPRMSAVPKRRSSPGDLLRAARLTIGLTLRDVHRESVTLARKLRNRKFILPPSRLHDFEVQSIVPGIHRLYTLSHVYEIEVTELLHWYGIPLR